LTDIETAGKLSLASTVIKTDEARRVQPSSLPTSACTTTVRSRDMSEQTDISGGPLGDPAEASAATAAGNGCCGAAATATVTAETPATAAGPCCGTAEPAQAENSCCGAEAKTDAVAAGTGCCG
jgi:hypothetical protein